MAKNLQSLNMIRPVSAQDSEETIDTVKKEYQEALGHAERKEYGQAALAFHNALLAFEEKADSKGIANASNQLGHLCSLRNDHEASLLHYKRALSICMEADDSMSILAVLGKIVTAHRELKQYDEAQKAAFKMLDIYQDNRDPQGSVATLELIAEIFIDLDQPKNAADAYRTISSIHKKFNHQSIAARYLEKAESLGG